MCLKRLFSSKVHKAVAMLLSNLKCLPDVIENKIRDVLVVEGLSRQSEVICLSLHLDYFIIASSSSTTCCAIALISSRVLICIT